MNSISRWTLDGDKKTDGIWIDLGHGEKIRVRPSGRLNPEQMASIRKAMLDAGSSDTKDFTPQQAERFVIESLADHVLIDWKGFTDLSGAEMKPTRENKVRMLGQELFRMRVEEEATKIENFLIAEERTAVKN